MSQPWRHRFRPRCERLEERAVPAASPFLVKDINPGTDGSFVAAIFGATSPLANVNGTLFFRGFDANNGYELWKSDGTSNGTVLVKDINPGTNGSTPSGFTDVNGTLFFSADDGSNGVELWKSDGTSSGTVLVKDIDPGFSDSYPLALAVVNGTLYFSALDGNDGVELWKSDGTSTGTVLVKDINPGSASSNPLALTNVNGTLFFTANDGTSGTEVWKSDGTSTGTVRVADINPGAGSSNPLALTASNGSLFFSANDGTCGTELWKSDGTGTVLVKDINPGTAGSGPVALTDLNGTLFFNSNDGTSGTELWKSNGTSTGTVLVKDINVGTTGSGPFRMSGANGTLFFLANDGTTGAELWRSDGSSTGTVLVKDINPGNGNSSPGFITNLNGTIFFVATDGSNGYELWRSDGSSTGTVLVQDINPGTASSSPFYLTNVSGTLFFAATTVATGRELWALNQRPVVTQPIASQTATAGSPFSFSVPAGTFSDPDTGDTLTLSATLSNGGALPSWLMFNAATGSFSGTPGSGDVGPLMLTVTATDPLGARVSNRFSLTVSPPVTPPPPANQPPVLSNPIANQTATAGTAFSFQIPANTFSDPDPGDTLTFRATLSSRQPLPSWLTFDPATRTFSGTPGAGDVGTLLIRVTVSDGGPDTISTTFTLTVNPVPPPANRPPVLTSSLTNPEGTAGVPFSYTIDTSKFSDPDAGDTLTFSATQSDGSALPAWLTFNPATRTFSGTPQLGDVGFFGVKVTATDRGGLTAVAGVLFVIRYPESSIEQIPVLITNQTRFGYTPNPDATTALVRGLYLNLLGFDYGAAGVADAAALYSRSNPADRLAQIRALYESEAHRTLQVASYFRTFFHREPTSQEVQFGLSLFKSGSTEADIITMFLGSQGYQSLHPTSTSFVDGMYNDLLGTPPDAATRATLANALDARQLFRRDLARTFLFSPEVLTRFVVASFTNYLGRQPTPGEVNATVNLLQTKQLTFAGLIVNLLGGVEFQTLAGQSVG